jgi:hypothetical protein
MVVGIKSDFGSDHHQEFTLGAFFRVKSRSCIFYMDGNDSL